KSSKSNDKVKHEPSYDVIYEGEITVPMDVDVLITGLIVKHNHYIDKYQAEFDTLDPVVGEIMPKLEAAKKGRDEINERIVVLKEKRRQLYHQAKGMRTEMYKLMDIDNDLKSAPIESKKIRDEIEELDWTLQTTQISTSKERDIVKNIRILDAKLHTMDEDVDREAEVSTKISELKETLTATMDEANSAHEEIMSIADESQKFHEEYIKYNEVARGSGGRHKWLSARITSHREALTHWNERQAGGVAND
ncbi:MAG: hypothetical protein KAJ07_11980, partial [Planctomycetes bacterium]|nr:hypothetical protein [Planctomycetota bacterium]